MHSDWSKSFGEQQFCYRWVMLSDLSCNMAETCLGTLWGMQYMHVNGCSNRVMLGKLASCWRKFRKDIWCSAFPSCSSLWLFEEEDSFAKVEMKEYVLFLHDDREQQWPVEDLPGVWQLPLLESTGVVLWKEPLSIRISRGTSVLLGLGQSHMGREGLMKSCLLLCPLLFWHSTKKTGVESPLKALKSSKWSFWNILSHPPFPRSQQQTERAESLSRTLIDSYYSMNYWYLKKILGNHLSLVIITTKKELLR